jgi:hypothetical protein
MWREHDESKGQSLSPLEGYHRMACLYNKSIERKISLCVAQTLHVDLVEVTPSKPKLMTDEDR